MEKSWKMHEEENFVTANYTDWVQIQLYQNCSHFIIKYIQLIKCWVK